MVTGLLLAGAVAAMYVVAILLGDVNQDEGWYLYASRLVHEGKHPFLDFASTQGPVMAYVYGLAYPLTAALGVAGGRVFTAVLGGMTILLASLLAARIAFRSGGRPAAGLAALLAGGLLGLDLYHVYFTSLVKTYGLAGLLTVLGFLGLERALMAAERRDAAGGVRAFAFGAAAAGFFAVAAGTRLSAGVLLPGVWLPLAVMHLRGDGHRNGGLLPVLAGMLAGGTAALTAVYLPFFLAAPESLAFGLLEYHAGRQVGGVAVLLAYKAGFLLRLAAAYFPAFVLGALGLAGQLCAGKGGGPPLVDRRLALAMAGGVAAVTAVHMAAPFPYDDYQVFVMPCLIALAAVPVAVLPSRLGLTSRQRSALAAGALALMLVHSASSPLLQSWVTAGRDRIWWPLRTESPLQGLRRAAAAVRDAAGSADDGANDLLLTQDTYLAVEARMRVPEGMELGPFCFFPGLDDRMAARYHVLNESRLVALIGSRAAAVAAFSGYGLAIRAPEVTALDEETAGRLENSLLSHYAPLMRMENFGQGETTLRILKRRSDQP